MKSALFALVTVVSMMASAKYVTVVLYDGGESGTEKRVVTYKVREASAPIIESCQVAVGEAGYAPCPTHVGIPKWLAKLNQAFLDAGFTAPDTSAQDELSPGGN